MDFSLSDDQRMFLDMFREFAEREVARTAEETDHAEQPPVALIQKAAGQGMLGALVPEAYGGIGLDFLSYTLLIEEIAKRCLSTAMTLAVHSSLACRYLLEVGDEAQKQRFLPAMAAGESLGAFALTEPDAGSDVSGLQTRARLERETYTLNGTKSWVSNAGLAGTFVVVAATRPESRLEGLSAFAVESGSPGLVLGHREPTLGMRGLTVHTLYFEDCPVPAAQRLGAENAAWPVVRRVQDVARLTFAAAAMGAAEGALALGVAFASERKQFGAAIAKKQAIQNYIAETAAEIESVRHLIHYGAWRLDNGMDVHREASMARLLGGRLAREAANRVLQIHGGYGFSDEYTISRIYRDVRALRLMGGTDEIQRVDIARGVLAGERVGA